MLEIIVIVVAVLLAVLMAVGIYNRFIQLKQRIDNALAQIDVQLKRRYDLIPNLIETVKGYAKHEKSTFMEVTELRSKLISGTPTERTNANNLLTDALKSIFAVAENYPQLKANENFKALQDELAGTENKISYVRTAYNDAMMEYNTAVQQFPSNIMAKMFGFTIGQYLETPGTERENVKVRF